MRPRRIRTSWAGAPRSPGMIPAATVRWSAASGQLARIELQVALSTLLRRIPGLRLATPLAHNDFKHTDIVYGLRSMPVTW